MLLLLYRTLTTLLEPCIHVLWAVRAAKGKEDSGRKKERFGRPSITKPSQRIIWIHAASVGESHSIIPLLKVLHNRYTEHSILLTTNTQSSAKLISKKLPERAFHQYIPYDIPRVIRRFLRHWNPEIAIFVESELWPNMIVQTAKQTRAMLLVNGRMSERSYHRWMSIRSVIQPLLQSFNIIHPGSRFDDVRFKNLGAEQAKYVGNLKYDAPALPADAGVTGKLLGTIGDRRLWLASSTHPGEEELIADAHQQIKDTHSEILTIIVPRHPKRAEKIIAALKEKKLTVARRSLEEPITQDTDIYLADTFGELGIFYRMVGIAFIGGSLIPQGGHNPIEAAQLDCAVVAGPHMHNFRAIVTEFEEAHAIARVKDAATLAETVSLLLRDQETQQTLAENGLELVKQKRGVVDNVMEELSPFLEPTSQEDPIESPAQGDKAAS